MSRKSKYYDPWIHENVSDYQAAYGKCADITQRMVEAFPELTRVRGHYYCPCWGEREHWWLTDLEGDIVDPTKSQFPSHGHGAYVPRDESQPEPTGKCPNCGDYCYNGDYCCSESCGSAFVASCM